MARLLHGLGDTNAVAILSSRGGDDALANRDEVHLTGRFSAVYLLQDGAQRQRTLEVMHQDLKAEAEANASEGEARQFHERRANRYLQLIQELRIALVREKSLRERDKLVLDFLAKIAPLVKGILPAP